MQTIVEQFRSIRDTWHEAAVARDLDKQMSRYADACLVGKHAIRDFFAASLKRLDKTLVGWWSNGTVYASGDQIVFEYRRNAPASP
jgi:hypothetical protein